MKVVIYLLFVGIVNIKNLYLQQKAADQRKSRQKVEFTSLHLTNRICIFSVNFLLTFFDSQLFHW